MGHAGFSIGGLIRVSYGFIHPIFVHSIRLVLLFEFLWNLFFLSAIPFCLCCFENGFVFFGVFFGAFVVMVSKRNLVMIGDGCDRKDG